MKKKILIIDDDIKLCKLLTSFFSSVNYEVESVHTPAAGLSSLKKGWADLIILDIMLPEINGFELCKQIRKDYTLPIIMLTARGEVTDRIVGLELGADDYLPKPFEPRELLARVESVLRRSQKKQGSQVFRFGDLEINLNTHIVTKKGTPLELTSSEFSVLVYFVHNAGIVVNRDQLLEKIRGIDWDPLNRSVDVLVSRLRQKLEDDPKNPQYIKTVWGTGYMFIGKE
jgi:two-component system phosphate regulon response regulator OmpR